MFHFFWLYQTKPADTALCGAAEALPVFFYKPFKLLQRLFCDFYDVDFYNDYDYHCRLSLSAGALCAPLFNRNRQRTV